MVGRDAGTSNPMLSGNGVIVTDYYSKVSVSRKGEAVTSWFGCEIPRICRCATYNTPGLLVERSSKLDARHAPLITTPAPASVSQYRDQGSPSVSGLVHHKVT